MGLQSEKKKKIGDFVVDFDQIEGLVDKLMKQMAPELPSDPNKPVVFGFSMRLDSNGKPVIEEFGNVSKRGEKPVIESVREPLVDVQKTKKNVLITVELPGVEKKDVKINVSAQNSVEIIAAGSGSFYKKISLPVEIKKGSEKVKVKNGILEASFDRLVAEK